MATVKSRVDRLEAECQRRMAAAYGRTMPRMTDAELEAISAMPYDGSPNTPEATAAMTRLWGMFDAAERRTLASEWKAAGAPIGVVENGSK